MICDSKCCCRLGEKIWCKKNLGLKGLMNLFQIISKSSIELCMLKNRKEYTPQRNTFPKDHFNKLLDLTYRHNVIRARVVCG